MEAREKQIPTPTSWEAFEDLCLELFNAIWSDPLAQKNGRCGLLSAESMSSDRRAVCRPAYFGVQCKGKDQGVSAHATVREIEDQLTKADKFEPPLLASPSMGLIILPGDRVAPRNIETAKPLGCLFVGSARGAAFSL